METKIELSVDVNLYVVITVDDEYGGELTKVTEIDKDWESDYSTLIEVIEEKKGKWCNKDFSDIYEEYKDFNTDILDYFNSYVPCGRYGVPTIESIKILQVLQEKTLY
jgi:hypothetical protein